MEEKELDEKLEKDIQDHIKNKKIAPTIKIPCNTGHSQGLGNDGYTKKNRRRISGSVE